MTQDPTSENVMKSLNRLPSSHPDIETLIAYAEQQLDEETYDTVQEHLISCETCTETLLSFHEFKTPDLSDVAASISEAEISVNLYELQTRLEQDQATPFWKHYQVAYAIAACFALFAITTVLTKESVPPLRVTHEQPTPVLQLRQNQRPAPTVYQKGDLFAIDLSPFGEQMSRIVLTNQSNDILFEQPVTQHLLVETQSLRPGKYTIQLLDQEQRIATFYFEIED